jgi:phosphoenolpyruvate synthase/pyruvate phosphate dikinase
MKYPLIFKKNAELFKWGPIPGKYFYVSEFEEAVFKESVRKYKCESWPKALLIFNKGKFVWINDLSEIQSVGKRVFIKFILPEKRRRILKRDWIEKVKKLTTFEKKINKRFLKSLSDEKFNALYDEFHKTIIDFWASTIPAELGNYGSDRFLEDEIRKIIKNKNSLSSAMEILTAPETISFYQEEEIDLLETNNLKKHQERYFWIGNSYHGAKTLSLNFFKKRKKNIDPEIRKNIKKHLKEVKQKKKEIISKYKLSKEMVNIAKAICEGISWQDERKKHIFIYTHYKNLFLKELARRYNLPIRPLENYSLHKIIKAKDINNLIKKKITILGFVVDTHVKELSEKESAYYWKEYVEGKSRNNIKEIKGIIASQGKKKIIQGKVKIVLDPQDKDFKIGNILVAPMTSPEYVFLMKKSKAIITDAGGLTSHAAIVSRELKIPCIVNTKIATKVLKDNDLVEIDASKGIIKKL